MDSAQNPQNEYWCVFIDEKKCQLQPSEANYIDLNFGIWWSNQKLARNETGCSAERRTPYSARSHVKEQGKKHCVTCPEFQAEKYPVVLAERSHVSIQPAYYPVKGLCNLHRLTGRERRLIYIATERRDRKWADGSLAELIVAAGGSASSHLPHTLWSLRMERHNDRGRIQPCPKPAMGVSW